MKLLHTVSPCFLNSLPNGLNPDACPYSVLETQISQMATCNSKRLKSSLSLIVRMNVVLNRTVVVDGD